jgi:hypothetical protein
MTMKMMMKTKETKSSNEWYNEKWFEVWLELSKNSCLNLPNGYWYCYYVGEEVFYKYEQISYDDRKFK